MHVRRQGCEHTIGLWVCVGSRVIRFRYDHVGVMRCGACSNVGISISRRVSISRRGCRYEDGTRTAHVVRHGLVSHTQTVSAHVRSGGLMKIVPCK